MTNNSLEHHQGVRYKGQARGTSIPIIRSDEGYWMKGEATIGRGSAGRALLPLSYTLRWSVCDMLCTSGGIVGRCHDGLDLGPHGSMKISKV